MTKHDLEQIGSLRAEIKNLVSEIDRAEKTMAVDTVIGSRTSCPWDPHPILIKGIDTAKANRFATRLNRKCQELQDQLAEVENWIESLEDAEMRTIIRLYYRNGLTDEQIGKELSFCQQRIWQKRTAFVGSLGKDEVEDVGTE